VRFDPFSFDIQQDPYPAYTWLRDESPVYHVEEHDLWVLSRYDDIKTVIRDWHTYSNREGVDIDKTDSLLAPGNMDEKDGPEHDVYRKLLQPWFSPKLFQQNLAGPIREETAKLVGGLVAAGSGDVTEIVAWQLPTFVVARMFDLPDELRPELLACMKPVFARRPDDPVPPPESFEAGEKIMALCRAVIADRRRAGWDGRDDVISMLLGSSLDGRPLDDEQILGMVAHLIVASSGTTQDLITNSVWLLGLHPDERRKLVADPSLIPGAVEEAIRFETVIQSVSRVSNETTVHHGTEVPAGATIVNLLGSANRDERYWDHPEQFDVTGRTGRHVAFGDGIHHCIGAPIARLEAKLVLEELLAAWPDYSIAEPPVRAVSHVARGFERLVIGAGA
jgi:cytochrome P450